MRDCGHHCCAIPDNDYHRHVDPPAHCRRCARSVPDEACVAVGDIVADVVAHVAPEIPGLPTGAELVYIVVGLTLSVHAAAIGDPALGDLSAAERRAVLVGRVGLALAFPTG